MIKKPDDERKSLKRMYFLLSLEWYKKKNGPIPSRSRIQDIAFREVWWKCDICGNEWQDSVSNRLRGEKPCECGIRIEPEDEIPRTLRGLF